MPKFQINFTGRTRGAIGVFEGFWRTVEAADFEAAKLKLYETYDHISVKRSAELVLRYAITHVNKDGYRVLTFANQGRNHCETRGEAEAKLAALVADGSLRAKSLHEMADTLAVWPMWCYGHGDAVGIYALGAVETKARDMGAIVDTDKSGRKEADFPSMVEAESFRKWMLATERECSALQDGFEKYRYAVTYDPKLDER